MTPPLSLPLDGVVVLDFSQFLAGPSCALRLADLGARVIKVERPDGGDGARSLSMADQHFDRDTALFHTINRNKESYAADLKDPADAARVRALIGRADVLIHNFRPGIMDRLGLGFDAVTALNPRIVYAGISGYGHAGPWRNTPGQDLLVQARTGFAWLSGDAADGPVPTGLAVADMAAGAQLVQAILALLVRRGVTGRGGRVDVSLMEAAIDLQFEPLTVFLNGSGDAPRRSAVNNANIYLMAPYGIYATADGHVALAMMPVDRLGVLIGCSALAAFPADRWYADRDTIKQAIADHLVTRPSRHWLDILEPAGLWAAETLDWPALVAHDAFAAIDPVQPIVAADGATMQVTRCPIRVDGRILRSPRPAPRLGADTASIATEFQLDEEAA
ncbi:CaiB/BaiF CoA transferase family protein [Sphingomonas montana]|uniref:CaiB/BaiF CoA transferase family protein n=1 Tax=Sphingomonas montana TaxID=1843236 RepID=UPI00096E1F8D|nr:CaiB/BaiF CoA-transferase family protein [Sphingomonas montana]